MLIGWVVGAGGSDVLASCRSSSGGVREVFTVLNLPPPKSGSFRICGVGHFKETLTSLEGTLDSDQSADWMCETRKLRAFGIR